MDIARTMAGFEALAKITLLVERITKMRHTYRGEDLIPLLDQFSTELDRLELRFLTERERR